MLRILPRERRTVGAGTQPRAGPGPHSQATKPAGATLAAVPAPVRGGDLADHRSGLGEAVGIELCAHITCTAVAALRSRYRRRGRRRTR
jgi:hypothetical protein